MWGEGELGSEVRDSFTEMCRGLAYTQNWLITPELQLTDLQRRDLIAFRCFPGFPRPLRRFPSIPKRCSPAVGRKSALYLGQGDPDVPRERRLFRQDNHLVLMRDVTLDESLRAESARQPCVLSLSA